MAFPIQPKSAPNLFMSLLKAIFENDKWIRKIHTHFWCKTHFYSISMQICILILTSKQTLETRNGFYWLFGFQKERPYNPTTMLQKLSKCEVKASLCWNLTIFPPLRFYVKSNLVNSNSQKMSFMPNLEVMNFDLM